MRLPVADRDDLHTHTHAKRNEKGDCNTTKRKGALRAAPSARIEVGEGKGAGGQGKKGKAKSKKKKQFSNEKTKRKEE